MVASQAGTGLPDGGIWIVFSIQVAWPDNARVAQNITKCKQSNSLSLSHTERNICSPLVFVYIVSFFCFSTGFASIRSFKGSRGKDKILDRWHTRERQAFFFGFLFFLFFLFVMESLIYLHIPVSFRLLVAGCVINQNAADDAEIRPFLGRG